jgi:hypothetical protein
MDPLAIGVVVFVAVLVALALVSARANAGKPLSEFGARERPASAAAPSSSQLEYQDLAEMLEATNARRRARGLPERSMTDAMREFGAE